MRRTFRDHDTVRLRRELPSIFDKGVVPAGAEGEILTAYPVHNLYTIRIQSENDGRLVDARAQDIDLVGEPPNADTR